MPDLKLILNLLGKLVLFTGIALLVTILIAIIYNEDIVPDLLISAGLCFVFFILTYFFTKKKDLNPGKKEAFAIVALSWIFISAFGAIPFVITGYIPSYTDAFFETISGFTTTGATIITDIEALPYSLLFWRSLTHWIGGMGIIVLTIAIIPFLGVGGMQLFAAEVPGVSKNKISPRIKHTAQRLWLVYLILTIAEVILLLFGGMNLFDAVCHSFATMATGGFSTKNASIAFYQSPFIEYVIVLFMFLAGVNFSLNYFAIRGKFNVLFKDDEFKTYLKTVVLCTLTLTGFLLFIHHYHPEKAFRDSIFQVVSIITTTGFVTTNYETWGLFGIMFIFVLLFAGGSSGSTGGSIKIVRHLLLLKNTVLEFKHLIHPRAIIPVRYNNQVVSKDTISNVLAFFFLYILIFIFSSMLMITFGSDLETSMGATAATLGNVGPGIGHVGPVENYAHFNIASKWLLSFLMLIGRLELFTVLILFTRAFWKK